MNTEMTADRRKKKICCDEPNLDPRIKVSFSQKFRMASSLYIA